MMNKLFSILIVMLFGTSTASVLFAENLSSEQKIYLEALKSSYKNKLAEYEIYFRLQNGRSFLATLKNTGYYLMFLDNALYRAYRDSLDLNSVFDPFIPRFGNGIQALSELEFNRYREKFLEAQAIAQKRENKLMAISKTCPEYKKAQENTNAIIEFIEKFEKKYHSSAQEVVSAQPEFEFDAYAAYIKVMCTGYDFYRKLKSTIQRYI